MENMENEEAPQKGDKDKDIQDNKTLAALSYIWIVSLIMLLVKKDSPYVQFHAKQGLVLWVISIILGIIPVVGWALEVVVIVFMVMGIVKSLQGEYYKLPLVGNLAQKINF